MSIFVPSGGGAAPTAGGGRRRGAATLVRAREDGAGLPHAVARHVHRHGVHRHPHRQVPHVNARPLAARIPHTPHSTQLHSFLLAPNFTSHTGLWTLPFQLLPPTVVLATPLCDYWLHLGTCAMCRLYVNSYVRQTKLLTLYVVSRYTRVLHFVINV